MTVTFDESTRAILDGKNFATVATVGPGGMPHASVVWFARRDDTIRFSITTGRQKARNLARDPRISLAVYDRENPYSSVEIRGTAELSPDPTKELPRELSHKYLGTEPPQAGVDEVRLVVTITPHKVLTFSA